MARIADDTMATPTALPLDGSEVVRLVTDPAGTPDSAHCDIDDIKAYTLAGLTPPGLGSGQSFTSAVCKLGGTLSQIGDSTTDDAAGRPAWQGSVDLEWVTRGGIFEGWTVYNNGQNGETLDGWVNAIDSGDEEALPTARDNPWAVVNANPDVIMICLGINDQNNPGARASIGTKAAMQTNLATLINFLLDNTEAAIWLRMPQPLAFEDFFGTDWVDADETALSNQNIREVYENWVGVTDRVEVFNTHRALYGLRCDDKATDCLDPISNLPMVEDSLHPSNIGFRRIVDYMHMQARGTQKVIYTPMAATNLICQAAYWSAMVHIGLITTGANSIIDLVGNPRLLRHGDRSHLISQSSRTTPVQDFARQDDYFLLGNFSAIQQLRLLKGKGSVKIYFPASGNIFTATNVTLTQVVDAGGDDVYYRFTLTGADLTGEAVGPALIYVEGSGQHPFVQDSYHNVNIVTGESQTLGVFRNDAGIQREIVGGSMVRSAFAGVTGAADAYIQPNNDGTITGTLMGSFAFFAGGARADFVVDATNFPSGVKVNAGQFIIRMAGYSNIGQGQACFQMRYAP